MYITSFRRHFDQISVVKLNAQFARKLLGNGTAVTAELSAYSDDSVVTHIQFHLSNITYRYSFCYLYYSTFPVKGTEA
jgi:hypothetical protein